MSLIKCSQTDDQYYQRVWSTGFQDYNSMLVIRSGPSNCIVTEKSKLHSENIAKRVEWAIKHKDLIVED